MEHAEGVEHAERLKYAEEVEGAEEVEKVVSERDREDNSGERHCSDDRQRGKRIQRKEQNAGGGR